jgi:hypothetical protein
VVGFWVVGASFGREGVIGDVLGVYRQVVTEGDLTGDAVQYCRIRALEAFRAGEGVDRIRESVRLVMQELIETEAAERIGSGRYERTDAPVTDRNGSRVTDRNGPRRRLLATQAGDVDAPHWRVRRLQCLRGWSHGASTSKGFARAA